MKRALHLLFCLFLGTINPAHSMQVAQTTRRLFHEPSFFITLRKLILTPALVRLSTPHNSTHVSANPSSLFSSPVPFWFQSPNGNGKLGLSVPTAAAAATVVGLLVVWYLVDEYHKKHSTVRTVGNAVVSTGFSTIKRCLFVMGNAVLFGVSFWLLESCLLYTLEKVFQISVNNPQMYNILLTVLAASFYVMITQVVKEKWQQKTPVTIGAPRASQPKEEFQQTFNGSISELSGAAPQGALLDFLGDGANPEALKGLTKPVLILGGSGSGKTELLHDITIKANDYCQIPVHELIVSRCKPSQDARRFIESAIDNVIADARSRGQQKGILIIDDIDQVQNPYLIQELTQYLRQYARLKNSIKIIVIATATNRNIMQKWLCKFDWCQIMNYENAAEQEPLMQRSISFNGNESFQSLHHRYSPPTSSYSSSSAIPLQEHSSTGLFTEQVSVGASATSSSNANKETLLETDQNNLNTHASTSSSSSAAAQA